jgi:multisubunit Na+/H+ antiporter MnhG subunit
MSAQRLRETEIEQENDWQSSAHSSSLLPMETIQSYFVQASMLYILGTYVVPSLISAIGVALISYCCLTPAGGDGSDVCTKARIFAIAIAILINIGLAMIGPAIYHYSLAQVQYDNRGRDLINHKCDEPAYTLEMTNTCNDLHAQHQLSPGMHAIMATLDATRKSFMGSVSIIIAVILFFWWIAHRRLTRRAQLQAKQKWAETYDKQVH